MANGTLALSRRQPTQGASPDLIRRPRDRRAFRLDNRHPVPVMWIPAQGRDGTLERAVSELSIVVFVAITVLTALPNGERSARLFKDRASLLQRPQF